MISYQEFRKQLIAKNRKWGTVEAEAAIRREYERYVREHEGGAEAEVSTDEEGVESPNQQPESDMPFMAGVFVLLAVISLLGGLVLSSKFWPGDPGYGREWATIAYGWSIVWMVAGVVQAALFGAIASILTYLNRIAINTSK